MTTSQWWPLLDRDIAEWLVQNNGDSLTPQVAQAVLAAGGTAVAGSPLADDDVDWIEAWANGE